MSLKFGFDCKCIDLIRPLCRYTKARVATNGIMSGHFHMLKGNRQGRQLSPAFFGLAMEPLAKAVRMDPYIYVVLRIGPYMHQMPLFAFAHNVFFLNKC